jgi:hypothetical protein
MRSTLDLGAAVLIGGTFFAGAASAQCPPVNDDTGCGFVITVTDKGATVMPTGQGPYDGSDDTLIGVVNNSRFPVFSLDLSSGSVIFGFDGDGIDTFGIPSNAKDGTGYGGPNAYYTNINAAQTSGRINFITPIPTGGGSSYFSLEMDLTGATGCTTLLNNSLCDANGMNCGKMAPSVPSLIAPDSNDGKHRAISATFIPQGNDPNTGQPFTLAAAAQVCGFIGWDWQQTITTLPTPLPDSSFNAIATPNTAPVAPFNDPPPSGYRYMLPVPPGPLGAPQLAVYYDPFNGPNSDGFGLASNETPTQLSFYDRPADPCLPGVQSAALSAEADGECGAGKRAPAGSTINFTTHLIGFQGQFPGASVVDTGIGFNWTSANNGENGGIATTAAVKTMAADPGSTGGNTVTSVTQTTTFSGVGVGAINGSTLGPSSLVAAVLPVSRSVQVGKTATAFVTIINSGTTTASACNIQPLGGLPLTFVYQTTNSSTNALTGTANSPIDIPAGGAQSFVIALTPTATIAPTNAQFSFACTNANPAPIDIGLTTLLLSGSTSPTPDVVALAATATNDGILHVPGASGTGAFATATVNVGTGGTITASTNTGSATLPLTLTICQSNPANGQCLAPPAASVTTTINANATPTFSIFGTASGAIPFDPANSRVFVTFTDSGNAVRGETSVAVETQ